MIYDIDKNGKDIGGFEILTPTGINYQGENYVYSIDLKRGSVRKIYILLNSYAIEGISIVDQKMYIANDGVYHKARIKANQINIYENFQ